MKEINLYEIKEQAIRSGRMVFNSVSLANLIGKKREIAKVYISRLAKAGLAKKLLRGKISFTDDEYIIATQLLEPSYISLLSALNFHGLMQQVPKNIQCINPKNTRTYPDLGVEYHKISRKLFFGYKTYKKKDSYIFVADKEKAVLDGLHLRQIEELFLKEVLNHLDTKKLLEYSKKFSKKIQKIIQEASKQ